jgi:acyl carrier protein
MASGVGEPDGKGYDRPDEYVDAVAEIWAEVLGLARTPSAGEGFLALGGGSLAAMQVVNRLRRRFGAGITIRDVLTLSTVAEVADLARSRQGTEGQETIPRVSRQRRLEH